VLAATERNVPARIGSLRVETVRVIEDARIAIRSRIHRHDDGPHRNVDVCDLGVPKNQTKCPDRDSASPYHTLRIQPAVPNIRLLLPTH
jgi:hypothetical protein